MAKKIGFKGLEKKVDLEYRKKGKSRQTAAKWAEETAGAVAAKKRGKRRKKKSGKKR